MNSQAQQGYQGTKAMHTAYTPSSGESVGVPMPLLEQLADTHANYLWGNDTSRGLPFAVVDSSGFLLAYVFPFRRGGRRFPDYAALFRNIAEVRKRYEAAIETDESTTRSFSEYFTQIEGEYGSIYVAVARSQPPILRVDHFLHPYFLNGASMREMAQNYLSCSVVSLERILSLNALEEYFEFACEDRHVCVESHSLVTRPTDEVIAPAAEGSQAAALPLELTAAVDSQIENCWRQLENNAPLGIDALATAETHSVKYMNNLSLVPPIIWTLNCATTAKAMILGYWDHYVSGSGTILGFGRLIDYWYEHPSNGQNVPNLLDEVHTANHIDAWKVNKYSCDWTEIPANAANDWAWQAYTSEIDAGRPAGWSISGHAMTGIGYRIEPWGRWAIVYSTWETKPSEFPYDKCIAVAKIVPKGGSNGDHLALLSPGGKEMLPAYAPNEIAWFVYGQRINKSHLYVSQDGGRNWSLLAKDIVTSPGRNTYCWFPCSPTNKSRVRVEGNAGTDYIAGDGSYQNVVIQPAYTGGDWQKISGPVGFVVAGYDAVSNAHAIFATDPTSGDVFQFFGKPGSAWNWIKVGGPGGQFVLDGRGRLYGLSPDHSGVHQYTGKPMQWVQIGGPAGKIYGDADGVCATNPQSGDIYRFLGSPFHWLRIGGPGKVIGSDAAGMLFGISPDGSGVYMYSGLFGPPLKWTQIGGPARDLYVRGRGVYVTNPDTGDIFFYHGKPYHWSRIGGPGKSFSIDTDGRLCGISPVGDNVWQHSGSNGAIAHWTQIGGPAESVYGGWKCVLAKNPKTSELWFYD